MINWENKSAQIKSHISEFYDSSVPNLGTFSELSRLI